MTAADKHQERAHCSPQPCQQGLFAPGQCPAPGLGDQGHSILLEKQANEFLLGAGGSLGQPGLLGGGHLGHQVGMGGQTSNTAPPAPSRSSCPLHRRESSENVPTRELLGGERSPFWRVCILEDVEEPMAQSPGTELGDAGWAGGRAPTSPVQSLPCLRGQGASPDQKQTLTLQGCRPL